MPRSRHTPERSCISCGQKLPKKELIRIVRSPDGTVLIDPTGKGPGRGSYLCTSEECWSNSITKGGLERSLRTSLSPQDKKLLSDFFQQQIINEVTVEG